MALTRYYYRSLNSNRKAWISLLATAFLFSTINVYFLHPESSYKQEVQYISNNEILLDSLTNKDHHTHDSYSLTQLTNVSLLQKSIPTIQSTQCPTNSSDSKYFQPVQGTDTFVYSAHHSFGKIYVVVFKKQTDRLRFFLCNLWRNSTSVGKPATITVTKGVLHRIPEDHGRAYSASYIICDLPQPNENMPFAVSILPDKQINQTPKNGCKPTRNYMNIAAVPTQKRFNFTVCVTPLNRNYSETHSLVEMIEFNRMLGADKIVFYNHSIHSNINEILDHYIKKGIVDLYQWPNTVQVINSHYYGQLAALNDCLHRYRSHSKYLVYQDLDEFIVPTSTNMSTWYDLMNSVNKHWLRYGKADSPIAVVLAQCTFFRKEWPKPWDKFPYNEIIHKYKSVILGHTIREAQILRHGLRSKYIMNPDLIETVGIHECWSKSGIMERLKPDVALLYHYRDWETPKDQQKRVEDPFVVKTYGVKLLGRLVQAWNELNNTLSSNS